MILCKALFILKKKSSITLQYGVVAMFQTSISVIASYRCKRQQLSSTVSQTFRKSDLNETVLFCRNYLTLRHLIGPVLLVLSLFPSSVSGYPGQSRGFRDFRHKSRENGVGSDQQRQRLSRRELVNGQIAASHNHSRQRRSQDVYFNPKFTDNDGRMYMKRNFPTPTPSITSSPAPIISDNKKDDTTKSTIDALLPSATPSKAPATGVPSVIPSSGPSLSAEPSTTFSPTGTAYLRNSYTDITDGREVFESTCGSGGSDSNDKSDSDTLLRQEPRSTVIESVLVSFDYSLTLRSAERAELTDYQSALDIVERVLHQRLSHKLMQHCSFTLSSGEVGEISEVKNAGNPPRGEKQKPFELMSLRSSPADVLDESANCGDACHVVHSFLTAGVFYISERPRRKRSLQSSSIVDPAITLTFGRTIVDIFNSTSTIPELSNLRLDFRGITNNAAYDTLGGGAEFSDRQSPPDSTNGKDTGDTSSTNDGDSGPMVSAIQTRSADVSAGGRFRSIGWGATIIAAGALALITVLGLLGIRQYQKQRFNRHKSDDENGSDAHESIEHCGHSVEYGLDLRTNNNDHNPRSTDTDLIDSNLPDTHYVVGERNHTAGETNIPQQLTGHSSQSLRSASESNDITFVGTEASHENNESGYELTYNTNIIHEQNSFDSGSFHRKTNLPNLVNLPPLPTPTKPPIFISTDEETPTEYLKKQRFFRSRTRSSNQ